MTHYGRARLFERVEGLLLGNICGRRSTSCADQLAIAVRKAYNKETSANLGGKNA